MVYLDFLCVYCQWMIKSTRDLQSKVYILACYSDLLSSIAQYLSNSWYS